VTAIQPVISERAETSLAVLSRGNRIARWERIAVASAKQCARAVVPAVHQAMPIDRYWNEQTGAGRVMCVEPSAAPGDVVGINAVPRTSAVHLIVGPEGGWSVTEIAAAHETGAILMSLGARTLRADAVPLVALTALLTTWGELI
jgi:16S rRNA (uracil1498-N3)-methyltransferase